MGEVAAAVGLLAANLAPGRPKIAKFPVKFPDNREFGLETSSYLTAHTTTPSFSPTFPMGATLFFFNLG
jgi:hypothetical protein